MIKVRNALWPPREVFPASRTRGRQTEFINYVNIVFCSCADLIRTVCGKQTLYDATSRREQSGKENVAVRKSVGTAPPFARRGRLVLMFKEPEAIFGSKKTIKMSDKYGLAQKSRALSLKTRLGQVCI